jgi:membrane carboxypeptidase/penicillin-binding protein
MIGATRGRAPEDFPVPLGTVNRQVCAETGMLATDACPNVTTEMFDEGSQPSEYCTTHPGRPLQPPAPAEPPATPQDLRDIDRAGREREHLRIR